MDRNEVDQTDDNALRTSTSCHDAHCHRAVTGAVTRMFLPLLSTTYAERWNGAVYFIAFFWFVTAYRLRFLKVLFSSSSFIGSFYGYGIVSNSTNDKNEKKLFNFT